MIGFLSSWAKGLGISLIIVSILEMILPNNKIKKYIKVVLGLYVIFNIISPLIQNKDVFNIKNLGIETNGTIETSAFNQTSMEERIKQLYEEELEKDIVKKIKEQGYEISKCKVTTKTEDEETKIIKIKLKIDKKIDTNNQEQNETAEKKIVTQIQKIKKIDTKIQEDEKENQDDKKEEKISKIDIQNVKKILIEEYEVNEKCLEIN